jgi:hypothetical protein
MAATLYLLRQQPDHISPSLFRASDEEIDIVFIEQAAFMAPALLMEGAVVSGEGIEVGSSNRTLTYDDLVEKIFSSEHVIVL